MSITDFVQLRSNSQQLADPRDELPVIFDSVDAYVASVKTSIDNGRLNIAGNPIVRPSDPVAMLGNAQGPRCNANVAAIATASGGGSMACGASKNRRQATRRSRPQH